MLQCVSFPIYQYCVDHDEMLTVGTDVRKLVFDGYVATNILGCDLRQEFIDLGYDLYQDRDTCSIRFFTDDLFSVALTVETPSVSPDLSQVTKLSELVGRIDHFYLGALFHLYDEEGQFAIALIVGKLLRREKGSIVFGRHQGFEVEGLVDDHLGRCVQCIFVAFSRISVGVLEEGFSSRLVVRADQNAVPFRNRYAHSPASWIELWKRVFTQLESAEFAETRVVVDAVLEEGFAKEVFMTQARTSMLYWSVKIV